LAGEILGGNYPYPILSVEEVNMETLHFSIDIQAHKDKVWVTMLDKASYEVWADVFTPGSTFEGSWKKGEKIKFLTPEGDGMTSMIVESKPNEFISIKHLGFIKDGIEDTQSPEVKAWAPLLENYTLSETNGVTRVKVDLDVTPDFGDYMQETWPKALAILKKLCES
jgi:hypothetical protein